MPFGFGGSTRNRSITRQPTIAEPPAIILFDGVCNLCSGVVHFLIARDPHARFRFAALQSEAARAACARVGHELPASTTPSTVVVIEHDMEFIRDLDFDVTVLHQGQVLTEGTLDQVKSDPRVIEVYLGKTDD